MAIVNNTIGGEWRDRYFVLQDGTLRYWRTDADYQAGKPSSEPIQLSAYEVRAPPDPQRGDGFAAAREVRAREMARCVTATTVVTATAADCVACS